MTKDTSQSGRRVKTGTLLWLPIILDDERLDAVETLLLVGLAEHVNGQDECFAGIDHLAVRGRCGYSTAKRRLAALAEKGAIARERNRRDDGNLSVYSYRLVRSYFGLPELNLSPDQSSPERALTRAHLGEPAEPPHDEPLHNDGAEQARRPAKRATQLPADWAPNEAHRALAAKHGVQDIGHEAEQFRNHHQAKGSVMKDWDAAFRTWLGNARRFSGSRHLQVVNGRPYGAPDDAVLIDGVWIR